MSWDAAPLLDHSLEELVTEVDDRPEIRAGTLEDRTDEAEDPMPSHDADLCTPADRREGYSGVEDGPDVGEGKNNGSDEGQFSRAWIPGLDRHAPLCRNHGDVAGGYADASLGRDLSLRVELTDTEYADRNGTNRTYGSPRSDTYGARHSPLGLLLTLPRFRRTPTTFAGAFQRLAPELPVAFPDRQVKIPDASFRLRKAAAERGVLRLAAAPGAARGRGRGLPHRGVGGRLVQCRRTPFARSCSS